MEENSWNEVRAELKEIKRDINLVQNSTAKLDFEIGGIKEDVSDIKHSLKNDFVTSEAFTPVKTFVYGIIAIISTGFITAILAMVNWAK